MKLIPSILLISALVLGGCETVILVPEDYNGPTAIIEDSSVRNTDSQADFFYVAKVDGQTIQNARNISRRQTHGAGFHMNLADSQRKVLPEQAVFEIVGRTEYAAPIQALTNKIYEVKGEVTFTPKARTIYRVKGNLGEDYSAVWIEEVETGEVVGEKIEIHGSTALGIMQK